MIRVIYFIDLLVQPGKYCVRFISVFLFCFIEFKIKTERLGVKVLKLCLDDDCNHESKAVQAKCEANRNPCGTLARSVRKQMSEETQRECGKANLQLPQGDGVRHVGVWESNPPVTSW